MTLASRFHERSDLVADFRRDHWDRPIRAEISGTPDPVSNFAQALLLPCRFLDRALPLSDLEDVGHRPKRIGLAWHGI